MATRIKEDFSILIHRETTVNGDREFRIKKGEIYQIVPRFDADAPDGFQEFRTTKIIDPEAGQQVVNLAIWDNDKNMYDTALTVHSKVLIKNFPDQKVREEVVAQLQKHILEPMIEIKGDVFDPKNLDFWDNEIFTINLDEVFKTEDPISLFRLYLLTIHGIISPKDFEASDRFKYAQYSVENKDGMVTLKQRKELEKNKAIGLFYTLLTGDKKKLLSVLDWMKVGASLEDDPGLLNLVFSEWVNNHPQNAQLFSETVAQFETPSGKKELDMYSHLVTLYSMKKLKKSVGRVELDGEFLGVDMKDATRKILQDRELTNKIVEILQ
jgi:hypothetical protein